jgi:V/A-type H+-transporting ATPase subunit G/H
MRIKDAEAAASTRLAEAEAEAQSMVHEARRQAEQIVNDGKTASGESYQTTQLEARAEADEEAKKLLSAGKRQATNLRKKFEAGVQGVAERAVGQFEESL